MKKGVFRMAVLVFFVSACNQKKNPANNVEQMEDFFPVLSFIKSQIAQVDTSLYSIKKIVHFDSVHSDTSFVPREAFRGLAIDFLNIPDLSEKKYKDRYKEEKLFDQTLNRVIITYTPKNPDKEEVQQQEVLITPGPSGDKVNSIIIEQIVSNKNSFLQKKMLWQVDRSFQITTISQKPAQPEITTTLKVSWNEED